MASFNQVVGIALVFGFGLSLVLTAIATASGFYAPDMWVGKYPPDIRKKYGPMSRRSARIRPYIAVLVFSTAISVPIAGLFFLRSKIGIFGIPTALVFSTTVLLVFNVFDLLILDWLFFCKIQPRSMILPGTEGMTGYRDYLFHFYGFLKGLVFCIVGSLLIVGFWAVAQKIAG